MRVFLASMLVLAGAPSALSGPMGPLSDHPDPGVSPSFALFPTHEEVLSVLQEFQSHPWIRLHDVGASKEGRPIQVAEITDPDSPIPREDRAVTFIFTQQHGNEPAGTPAALDLLREIAAGGPLADTLDNQVLLLLPMANPDGATANRRHNAQDLDVNRDHIHLESPEARALHEVLGQWDVHAAMDHHEYGGLGLGNPFPIRVYDYDLTLREPNHGNLRARTADLSHELMYEGVWKAAEAAGYTVNEYGEQTVAGVPVQQIAGGPDPGIMRNHLGLHHIAGLLVETRVDGHPNPFHDAARRAAIQRTVMDATLSYVHDHAKRFMDAKAASLTASVEEPHREYVEGETVAPLAPAYRVASDDSVDEVFERHGLPLGVAVPDGLVYNVAHELQGHAAAAIHPSSSRTLVKDAGPTDLASDPPEVPPAPPAPAAGIPAASAVMVLLAVFAMAGLRRRR